MAKRGGEAMAKRARERNRQAKQAAKQARRDAPSEEVEGLSAANETALMEEFAALSARYEAKTVSHEAFEQERHRIFVELGIESD
jgi:hypothetical protein